MNDLLGAEGVIRARVAPGEVPAAIHALTQLAPAEPTTDSASEAGWLSVHLGPDRAAEVTRVLANAGIYVSGLSSGNDLEELFLTLTASDRSIDPDGTFASINPAAGAGSPPNRQVLS
jgi:hypothetical protein